MSILVEPPSQLFFERPLTAPAYETLILSNPENEPVAFKVKTTSPKQYCVRPNSGKIEPGEKIEVQILLQPFKEEPPTDFKCRDKFLVQTAIIPPEKVDLPTSQLWLFIEQENKFSIKERKLRCVFLPPNDDLQRDDKQFEQNVSSPTTSYSEISAYNTAKEAHKNNRRTDESRDVLTEDTPRLNGSTILSTKELYSVKDELRQAKLTIGRLESELEAYKAKLKAAEITAQSPLAVCVDSNTDVNFKAMAVVAIVAFLLGYWLF